MAIPIPNPMNQEPKPELTPEQLQMLEANRRLMEFTNEILSTYFPMGSLMHPKKDDTKPNTNPDEHRLN